MPVHRVTRGLQIPIAGTPDQNLANAPAPTRVALVADDYVGMRPTLHVAVGDAVTRGQRLFEDKKTAGVVYTAPAAGRIVGIHRGERRAFQSLVIELTDAERGGEGEQAPLAGGAKDPASLPGEQVREALVESGLWTALRRRPFSRVADPAVTPRSIFVTAADTEPLAPDVEVVMRGREDDFAVGLRALSRLTEGPVFVCTSGRFGLTVPSGGQIRHERFAGPHPSGSVGYHIHTLDPVGRGKVVWHIGYQDVLAFGRFFTAGVLDPQRVVALAGPKVTRPRLLRTRIGAATAELTAGEVADGDLRVVSGSPLSGRTAMGDVHGYLGRYHRQVTVLAEGRERDLLGWAGPGFGRYSTLAVFLSRLVPGRRFAMTTNTNGSPRAIIPIGMYEKVMPFDLEPTFLLKALATRDVERAEQLGCLELDEEDLALCSFVCPGKNDYGPLLRDVLAAIEKDG